MQLPARAVLLSSQPLHELFLLPFFLLTVLPLSLLPAWLSLLLNIWGLHQVSLIGEAPLTPRQGLGPSFAMKLCLFMLGIPLPDQATGLP